MVVEGGVTAMGIVPTLDDSKIAMRASTCVLKRRRSSSSHSTTMACQGREFHEDAVRPRLPQRISDLLGRSLSAFQSSSTALGARLLADSAIKETTHPATASISGLIRAQSNRFTPQVG